uniref:(northern house mosquito) hypothetical protein n=1 Tax=Culex pipiens TaxID=7175 RepID=A0A8D8L8P7_CULPI
MASARPVLGTDRETAQVAAATSGTAPSRTTGTSNGTISSSRSADAEMTAALGVTRLEAHLQTDHRTTTPATTATTTATRDRGQTGTGSPSPSGIASAAGRSRVERVPSEGRLLRGRIREGIIF